MYFKIKEGYCSQVVNGLLNVTSETGANALMKTACSVMVKEENYHEACYMSFEGESVWGIQEINVLCLLNYFKLVCLPKERSRDC